VKNEWLAAGVLGLGFAGLGLWYYNTPLKKAERLMEAGDPTAATDLLSNTLAQKEWDSENEEALRLRLADAYMMRGALDNAETQYRKLIDLFPDHGPGHRGLGYIWLLRGHDAFAAEAFTLAAAKDHGDVRSRLGLAMARALQGDWPAAARSYEDVLKMIPGNRVARRGLAGALHAQGLFEAAAERYQMLATESPPDGKARLSLGYSLFQAGRVAEAEEYVRRLVDSTKSEAAALFLGEILMNTGRRDEAGAIYQRLHQASPRHFAPRLALAAWQSARGRPKEARALLEKINLEMPAKPPVPEFVMSDEEAWDILEFRLRHRALRVETCLLAADTYSRANDLAGAEHDVRRALVIDDRDPAALRMMADLARRRGDKAGREAWVARGLGHYPKHPAFLLDRAEMRLAAENTKDAFVDIALAKTACPRLARVQALSAEGLLLIGATAEAAKAAADAVAQDPTHAGAYLAQGLVQKAQGKKESALASFGRAAGMEGCKPRAYDELGRLLAALRRPLEARQARAEAHRLEPMVYKEAR